MLFSRNFSFLFYLYVCDPLSVNFYEGHRSVSRFTFTCGCPIVSSLLKRPSLLLALLLFLCQRSVDYIYVGLFLGSFFYSIALFVYSPTSTVFITAAL